jgi:hypothetical protein
MDWKNRMKQPPTVYRKNPKTRESMEAMRKILASSGILPRQADGTERSWDSLTDMEVEQLYRMTRGPINPSPEDVAKAIKKEGK